MRIQMISPTWPPENCGVGDYSSQLVDAFRNAGVDVTIEPRTRYPEIDPSIDAVFLQYTPSLFGRIPNFRLEYYLFQLRRKTQVIINFHELYYPVGFSPRGIIYGGLQFLRFILLCHLAHRLVFSTESWHRDWSRRIPYLARRFFWSPVGTNIPNAQAFAIKKNSQKKLLVHFGGNHPTHLYSYVASAAKKIASAMPKENFELVLIGINEHEQNFTDLPLNLNVVYPGFMPVHAVSELLKQADLVLQPFMDGISTRRGSVVAALAHGKPVITTHNPIGSPGTIPWAKGLKLADLSEQAFAEAAVAQMISPDPALTQTSIDAFFQTYFSWSAIAARLKQIFVSPL